MKLKEGCELRIEISKVVIIGLLSGNCLLRILQEEQIMYPSSLEHEKFIVAIVNSRRQECGAFMERDHDMVDWEVTRAIKCE